MIEVFILNENNKIELSKDQLEKLLNKAYWEGYNSSDKRYIYTSPYIPFYCSMEKTTAKNEIVITNNTNIDNYRVSAASLKF